MSFLNRSSTSLAFSSRFCSSTIPRSVSAITDFRISTCPLILSIADFRLSSSAFSLSISEFLRPSSPIIPTVSPVTTQETQLIGRGARYFPFKLNQEIIGAENEQYKRKFDEIPDNPLKVCETLYYHCIDNSKYTYDLQRALEETGFKQINEGVKFEYKLKKDFIESDIYKYGKLFINSYEEKPAAEISKIPDTFTIMSSTNLVKKSSVSKLYEIIEEENTIDEKIVKRTHKVTKVDKRILLKALRKFPVYEFSRLKSYFPLLKSHSEFLSSKDYAGRYEFVTITSGEPTNEDIYQGALRLFEILSNKILSIKAPLQGTHVFK